MDARDGSWNWSAESSSTRYVGLCFLLRGQALTSGRAVESGEVLIFGRHGSVVEWAEPTTLACAWIAEESLVEMGTDPFHLPAVLPASPLTIAAQEFILGFARAGGQQSGLAQYLTERILIDMSFATVIAAEGRSSISERRVPELTRAQTHFSVRSADPSFSVEIAAQELGLSVRQLQRIFSKSGSTPLRYLRDLRVESARELLDQGPETGLSSRDVARLSGFSSVRSMTRALHAGR